MEFTRGGVGVEWCGRECRPPLKLFVLGLRDPLLPRLQSRHAVLPQVRVYEIGLAHESQVCPGCGRESSLSLGDLLILCFFAQGRHGGL